MNSLFFYHNPMRHDYIYTLWMKPLAQRSWAICLKPRGQMPGPPTLLSIIPCSAWHDEAQAPPRGRKHTCWEREKTLTLICRLKSEPQSLEKRERLATARAGKGVCLWKPPGRPSEGGQVSPCKPWKPGQPERGSTSTPLTQMEF